MSFSGCKAGNVVSIYTEIRVKQEITAWTGISFIKNPYRPQMTFAVFNLDNVNNPQFVYINDSGQIGFTNVVASGSYIRIYNTYITKNP